jgi:hypothetical protein
MLLAATACSENQKRAGAKLVAPAPPAQGDAADSVASADSAHHDDGADEDLAPSQATAPDVQDDSDCADWKPDAELQALLDRKLNSDLLSLREEISAGDERADGDRRLFLAPLPRLATALDESGKRVTSVSAYLNHWSEYYVQLKVELWPVDIGTRLAREIRCQERARDPQAFFAKIDGSQIIEILPRNVRIYQTRPAPAEFQPYSSPIGAIFAGQTITLSSLPDLEILTADLQERVIEHPGDFGFRMSYEVEIEDASGQREWRPVSTSFTN